MFGAIAGGIASALAGGAMSKLFGGGQKADRKSGSAGMPRPISYAVFCLKKKRPEFFLLRLGMRHVPPCTGTLPVAIGARLAVAQDLCEHDRLCRAWCD